MEPDVTYRIVAGEGGFFAVLDEENRLISVGQELVDLFVATRFAQDHANRRGLTVKVITPMEGRSGSRSPVAHQPIRTLNLVLTPSMAVLLDRLSREMSTSIEDVITQGVALLQVAFDAQKRGQRLCLADEDLKVLGEIVDFGTSDGVGIDPFPEADADQVES